MFNGFLFDTDKNKIKVFGQTIGTSDKIAPGTMGSIQLGLGKAGDNFSDPTNIIAVANVKTNTNVDFALLNTGITVDDSGKYFLNVQIKNIGESTLNGIECNVILMGY